MGVFKKDTGAIESRAVLESNRRLGQIPQPSAKEQKVVDTSVNRGLNGRNRHKN